LRATLSKSFLRYCFKPDAGFFSFFDTHVSVGIEGAGAARAFELSKASVMMRRR